MKTKNDSLQCDCMCQLSLYNNAINKLEPPKFATLGDNRATEINSVKAEKLLQLSKNIIASKDAFIYLESHVVENLLHTDGVLRIALVGAKGGDKVQKITHSLDELNELFPLTTWKTAIAMVRADEQMSLQRFEMISQKLSARFSNQAFKLGLTFDSALKDEITVTLITR